MMRWIGPPMALFLMACGGDAIEPKPWSVEDEPEANDGVAAAAVEECQRNADCGEDEYCHRPSTCGEPNYCEEGYDPISAAPPIAVCGCDGTTRWANHGHPGPHAWVLGALDWSPDGGHPCDAEAEAPFDFTLRYRIVDDLPEGGVVWARLEGDLETESPVKEVGPDKTVEFTATGHQWASFGIGLLVDGDADGECGSESDIALGTYEVERRTDFVDFVFEFDVEQQSLATICGGW